MTIKTVIQIILAVLIIGIVVYAIVSIKKNNSAQTSINSSNNIAVDAVTIEDNIRGNTNAPVTLIEYSDYQCPYCVKHYSTMKKLITEYDSKVRWVLRSYPLPFHQAAEKASEAAEAAGEQGKFWEYSDKLMENSTQDGSGLQENDLLKYAEDLKLNLDQFKSSLLSGKYASKVKRDSASANKTNVKGTPTTFLVDKNGKIEIISGAISLDQLKGKIDQALN